MHFSEPVGFCIIIYIPACLFGCLIISCSVAFLECCVYLSFELPFQSALFSLVEM